MKGNAKAGLALLAGLALFCGSAAAEDSGSGFSHGQGGGGAGKVQNFSSGQSTSPQVQEWTITSENIQRVSPAPAAAPRANDRLRNAGPVNGNVPLTPLGDVAAPAPVPIPYPNTSKPVSTYGLKPGWPSKADPAPKPAVQAPSAAPASPPKIDAITIKQR
jgi:hypothetical protein